MTDVSIGEITEQDRAQNAGLRIEVAPGAVPGPAVGEGALEGTKPPTGRLEEAIVSAQGDDGLIGEDNPEDVLRRAKSLLERLQETPAEFVRQAEQVPDKEDDEPKSLLSRAQELITGGAAMTGAPGMAVPSAIPKEPRTALYRPGGPGSDPEDAIELRIDPPEGYRPDSPFAYMAKNAINGFYHGVDELQELGTNEQLSDLFPEYLDPMTGSRELFAQDFLGELSYDVGAMTAVIPPTLAAYAVAKGAGKAAVTKTLDPLLRRVIGAPYRTTLNAISPNVTRLKPLRDSRILGAVGQSAKYATAGAVGESIVTDDQELMEEVDRGDGVLVPRFAQVLIETDYPIVRDVGHALIAAKDDPVETKRILKFADDLAIGLVFDGAMYTAMFLGHMVMKGARKITGTRVDPDVPDPQAIDVVDPAEVKSAFQRTVLDDPSLLSKEELEEITRVMDEPGGFAIIESILDGAGVDYSEFKIMLGSLNTMHLQGSEEAGLSIIAYTNKVLEREALARGESWPPTKPYKATEEDAILFEQENAQALQENLERMGADGSPLRMHAYMNPGDSGAKSQIGGVELGPGLEGLDVFVLASRRALMRSNEHVYMTAKSAASKARDPDPLERLASKTAFLQAYMAHRRLQETVNGSINQVGRALSSMNMPVTGGQKLQYINRLVEAGGKDLDDLIQKIALTPDDPAELARVMNGLDDETAEIWKKISNLWHNSILSGFDTQLINAVGSVYGRTLQDLVEYPLAALTNETARKLGIELAPDSILMEDVAARLRSYASKQSLGTFIDEQTLNSKVIQMMRDGRMQELLGDPNLRTLDEVDDFLRKQDPALKDPRTRLRTLAQREIEMEVLANTMNMFKAFQFFGRAFMGDASTLARFRGSSSEFVAGAGPDAAVPVRGGIVNTVRKHAGTVLTYPGRTMAGVDSALKSLTQNVELHMAASQMIRNMRYQMEKNGNKELKLQLPNTKDPIIVTPDMLDPTKANGHVVQELIHRIVSNPPPSVLERANKEMLKSVYQANTPLTQGLGSIRRFLNDTVGTAGLRNLRGFKIPIGTTIFTFIKSPVNLLTFTMDRLPILYRYGKENRDALRTPGAARDMVLARRNVGILSLALSFELARRGIITGSSPAETMGQEISDRQAGFQPDSFVDPETGYHYPFTRLDPPAMTMGMGARLYQATQTFLKGRNLSEVEKRDVELRLGIVAQELFQNTITMMEDRLYISNFSDFINVIVKTAMSKEGEGVETALEGAAKIAGRQIGGLFPLRSQTQRLEEAYRTLTKLNPERIANLPTEERRKLMNDSFGAFDAGFLYDPRIRELRAVESTLLRTTLALLSGFPMLQQEAYSLATDGKGLYGKVTQFGEVTQKALPLPAGMPLTRQAAQPPILARTDADQPMMRSHAPLHLLERKYGFDPLRTPRKVTINGVEVALDPEQYHMRQRVQGMKYARDLRDIFMSSKDFNVEQMQKKIDLARKFAVQHGTQFAIRKFVQLSDRADKIGTVEQLEEEIRRAEMEAENAFDELQKEVLKGISLPPDVEQ